MEKTWQAHWIQDPRFVKLVPLSLFRKELDTSTKLQPHKTDLVNHHMLIRKTFTLDSLEGVVRLDITADDYYKLYINGQYVSQGPAPGYHLWYNYNQLDVSPWLQAGENVIAVHVYYQGLVNRVWNSGDYRQGMIAELFIDDHLRLATDDSWRYSICHAYQRGAVIGYDTQFLENIDARLLERHWRELTFDDGHWEQVAVRPTDDHKLHLQTTPCVQVYTIPPTGVRKLGRGHYLMDFGQEITGQFSMKACGTSGDQVEVRCGEELADDGNSVRYKMRCNCTYQEIWTLSGTQDTLEFYDYKAFRYVEVIGPEEALQTKSFESVVRHYPFDDGDCRFATDNLLLNQIWGICQQGVKYGVQEGILDCPSREKGQYLGDITVTGHSHLYLGGAPRLFKKALRDFANSAHICPGLMAVAPGSFMQEIADYSLQWPGQLLLYYNHTGDIEFLGEMYPLVQALLGYFQEYQDSDGLLSNVVEKWNLVDWPDNLRDGYDFPLSIPVGAGRHAVINAFFYGMIKDINAIRDILAVNYTDELPQLKRSFLASFFDQNHQLFVDAPTSTHTSLHANVLPLRFGLAPTSARSSIVNLIQTKGLSCGVYMSYFVLKSLAEVGEYQLVYDLITNQSEHSWTNMIREGATTCFEAWGKEQKWNTSLCHPWASAPIPVLIEDIVGIRPSKPGWTEIAFTPHIPKSLNHLSLDIMLPPGLIKVRSDKGIADIQVPPGVKVI